VLALGTGQAIKIAEQGNADILLVHHTPSEIKFVKEGYGVKRYDLMYNDFVIVGPINSNYECDSIENILLKIKNNELLFLSRGDDSGTHKKEVSLWNTIKFYPKNFSKWYLKVGQGMGSTLIMANEMQAYTLADRSTWLKFNKKENLKIII
jgi:tungstate transport system substrate-binding protein